MSRPALRLLRGVAFFGAVGAMALSHAESITRDVGGVRRVEFDLPGELVIRESAREQLTAEAEPKVLERLRFEQKADRLTITSSGSFSTSKPIRISLGLKGLRALAVENSGSVLVEAMHGSELDVNAGGSGSLRLKDVEYRALDAELGASGSIVLSGRGDALRVSLPGSGTIDAANYAAQRVEALLPGSGTVKVKAAEALKADLSGAGEILYSGNPKVSASVSGAGSIGKL